MAGTVGAIFNGALEVGSAIGLAAFSSIQSSVEATPGSAQEYNGPAAAFWFLVAIALIEILSISYFYHCRTHHGSQSKVDSGHDNDAVGVSEAKSDEADEVKDDTVTMKEESNDLPV